MDYETAKNTATAYMLADLPVMIWGHAGIGKSALVRDIAQEQGATVIDIRLSLFDPVDLRGMPTIENGKTIWNMPAIWPQGDNLTFIFLDELDRAGQAQRNAALQLILDRAIGEHKLPDNVRIFAAGNGSTDSGTQALGLANNNRFAHIEMESDIDAFCNHACAMDWNPAIPAFIRYKGASNGETALFEDVGRQAKAFARPRSWESVNRVLPYSDSTNRLAVIAGLIGQALAGEFVAFMGIVDQLPDIDAIIQSPDSADLPGRADIQFMLTGALARKATQSTIGAIARYLARLPKEFEIIGMRDICAIDPALKESSAFTNFAVNNQALYV